MRIYNIYTELNQLLDQTLDDTCIIDKYILLNESLLSPHMARSPQTKFLH